MSTASAIDLESPYPGLRPFQQNESAIFFGRSEQVDQLLNKLDTAKFLAVVGASGCGKSSLVRAGMLPALEGGYMVSAGSHWRVAEMRPGNQPFHNLAEGLLASGVLDPKWTADEAAVAFVAATLRRGPLGLIELLQASGVDTRSNEKGTPSALLLLVDQFEEIFRFRQLDDSGGAAAFVNLLLRSAAEADLNVYVVITMRSDFLGDCTVFDGLPEAINDGQFLTPRLSREQCRAAIVGPSAVFDFGIDRGLVNQILNDVGTDQDELPLMQHALMRMWTTWIESSENTSVDPGEGKLLITSVEYKKIGGLEKALSRHADEAYAELGESDQRVAEILFRCLSDRGAGSRDTRRPVTLGEVAAVASTSPDDKAAVIEALQRVVEAFRQSDRCFLTPPLGKPLSSDTLLDISHESLIRQWQKMKTWVEVEARSATMYRRLSETADLWQHGTAGLWGSPDLDHALEWRRTQQPTAAWARRYRGDFNLCQTFIDSSVQQRESDEREENERRERELQLLRAKADAESKRAEEQAEAAARLRKRAYIVGIACGIASFLAVASLLLFFSAYSAKADAERARDDAGQAAYNFQLRRVADLTVSNPGAAQSFLDNQKHCPTERRCFTWGYHYNQVNRGSRKDRLTLGRFDLENPVNCVAFSPTGKTAASAHDDGNIRVWDIETGELRSLLQGHRGAVNQVVYSEDSQRLFSSSDDATIKVWDVQTLVALETLTGPTEPVTVILVRIDERDLDDQTKQRTETIGGLSSVLWTWEPQSSEGHDLEGNRFPPMQRLALYSKEFEIQLAFSNGDSTIRFLDQDPLVGHTAPVEFLTFAPDGRLLASASRDNTVRLWQTETSRSATLEETEFEIEESKRRRSKAVDTNQLGGKASPNSFVLQGHRGEVKHVDFSNDGRLLASGSTDDSVIVWDVATHKPRTTLSGHGRDVNWVDFSPDGTTLATASDDGTVKIWSLDGSKGRSGFIQSGDDTPDGYVLSLQYSPDGKTLATGHTNGSVQLRDALNGTVLHTFQGHKSYVLSVDFSPDGKTLASSGFDGSIMLWTPATKGMRMQLPSQDSSVRSVDFSTDGKTLASAGGDGTIGIWDVETGTLNSTLTESDDLNTAHDSYVNCVRYSPDGSLLASASYDSTIKLWDTASGELQRTLAGHSQSQILSLDFSPDGSRLASCSGERRMLAKTIPGENTVKLWEVTTGKELATLAGHDSYVRRVVFSPDGRNLATAGADNTIRLWDALIGQEQIAIRGHQSQVIDVAFAPDGHTLVSVGMDRTIRFWPSSVAPIASSKTEISGQSDHSWAIAIQPNGKTLVAAGASDTLTLINVQPPPDSDSSNSRMPEPDTARSMPKVPVRIGDQVGSVTTHHVGGVTVVSVSPKGDVIATAGLDGSIELLDAISNRRKQILRGHVGSVRDVNFSPDGARLVSGGTDRTVRVWDVEDGTQTLLLDYTGDFVNSVAFSPNGGKLATAGYDGLVQIFNFPGGEQEAVLAGHVSSQVLDVEWSPDGKMLASAGGVIRVGDTVTGANEIKIWDAGTQDLIMTLSGHQGPVRRLLFPHTGDWLVSASHDESLRLWNSKTGKLLVTFAGHVGSINSVALFPDGTTLASSGQDGTIRLWTGRFACGMSRHGQLRNELRDENTHSCHCDDSGARCRLRTEQDRGRRARCRIHWRVQSCQKQSLASDARIVKVFHSLQSL